MLNKLGIERTLFGTIKAMYDKFKVNIVVSCCSVAQSCLALCSPMDSSMPGFPALHYLLQFDQTHVHWVNDAIQPSHPLSPLLLLPSVFPSIRVFSSESTLHIRGPDYWRFSFSPSNKYSGLIFFMMDWFDLLAVRGTLKSLLQHHNLKTLILRLYRDVSLCYRW